MVTSLLAERARWDSARSMRAVEVSHSALTKNTPDSYGVRVEDIDGGTVLLARATRS